jgi:hypothetical protein
MNKQEKEKQYAVSYTNFYDSSSEIVIVKATSKTQAVLKSVYNIQHNKTDGCYNKDPFLKELKDMNEGDMYDAFVNADSCIACKEID